MGTETGTRTGRNGAGARNGQASSSSGAAFAGDGGREDGGGSRIGQLDFLFHGQEGGSRPRAAAGGGGCSSGDDGDEGDMDLGTAGSLGEGLRRLLARREQEQGADGSNIWGGEGGSGGGGSGVADMANLWPGKARLGGAGGPARNGAHGRDSAKAGSRSGGAGKQPEQDWSAGGVVRIVGEKADRMASKVAAEQVVPVWHFVHATHSSAI